MPKMDGLSVLKEIRKTRPGIKTVFFSGYSQDLIEQNQIQQLGAPMITKPVVPTVLLQKVRSILDGKVQG